MFIYSMRAGTLRFFGIVFVALIGLVALVAFVPELQPAAATESEAVESETVSYEKIRSNEDRIAFLAQFGWQVDTSPTESTTVTIPREFDKVFAAYNELQRGQGLDLSAYAGRTVERYTYTVTNYENYAGTVYANLLIYRGRVIGGDICSADSAGFVQGFTK
ncbi:MAG: DUF4830 domain-containing protein [Ruminococcaceae bacterium]|nr:DUF4830 domain-containing protein [Oscillospiraceae bacterium]